jgi:curli biogenesis system outer membrane secretion channel CsgG
MKITFGRTISAAVALFLTLLVLPHSAGADQTTKKDNGKRLKLRIAVAGIDWSKGNFFDGLVIPPEIRTALDEKLAKRLLDTGKFVVLERAAMDAILNEKDIKEENTGQSQKGKIIPAQALIRPQLTNWELSNKGGGLGVNIGGIGRVGVSVSEAKTAINIRIIEVDTSRLLASEEAAGTARATGFRIDGNSKLAFASFQAFEKTPLGESMDKAITAAVKKIVDKLGEQPWSAKIADVDGSEIYVSGGEDAGFRVGDEFVVYKKGKEIRDPDTGEILGSKQTLAGRIRIVKVEPKLCVAQVVEGQGFAAGDLIKEK